MTLLYRIFIVILSINMVMVVSTGGTKLQTSTRSNSLKSNIAIKKIEKNSTGIVSDENGWKLWDENNQLTKEGRDATGKNNVVSSGNYEASQAGLEIIEAGGNAIDAAIATGFALCVTEPNATGIAGGGCMLIRTADGKTTYIDFREEAPSSANKNMWTYDENGKVITDENKLGGKSVAIPGQVAGLIYAFEKYGSGNVTLEEVMTPAINLAQNGIYVTPTLLKDMKSMEEIMEKFPELKKVILKDDNSYYNVGDLYKNQELADTLKKIAKEGKKGFYSGDIAKAIVDTVNKYGGNITLDDLKNYKVEELKPVEGTYRGKKIISSSLPSSGGIHIIEALNILENFNISKFDLYSAERFHLLSETFKLVYKDRAEYLGDSDFVDVPVNGLLSKKYAKLLASKINTDYSQNYLVEDPWIYEHEDTTHYSVADKKGNMVAVTQTINWTFGSGLVVDDYGFVLNNEISDFSTDADSPNCVEAGKKPLSSMSPTIILNKDDTPFLVLGSPGGSRIIPTVIQIISNVIDYDMNIQDAIDAYRMYDNTNNKIVYEGGISDQTVEKLNNMGHKVELYEERYSKHFGGVQAVQYKNGELIGGADSRRDGKALAN